jgi:hypothetical protein
VTPDHLENLEDYWIWLEWLVDGSGGWLEGPMLIVQPIEDDSGSAGWLGLVVPSQQLTFGNGSSFDVLDGGGSGSLSDHLQLSLPRWLRNSGLA